MMIWQKKNSCFISLAKLVKWQKCKTVNCDLTEKLLASNFVKMKIWLKSSNQSGGQTHGLILPIFVVFYNRFKSILCRQSCFHREWLLFSRIYMVLKFPCISKFKIIHILIKSSHSRWKKLDLQRNRDKTDIIEKKWTKSIHAFAL